MQQLVQITRRAREEDRGPGEVLCPRKGPLYDRLAWERCVELHDREPTRCGGCLQYRESREFSAKARAETGRQRWGRD